MTTRSMNPSEIILAISRYGSVTLDGQRGLIAARAAIDRAVNQAGFAVTFDPASAPDLVDYLTLTVVSGIEGAALGAGLGVLLGLLFDRPAEGGALGAGLGFVAGATRGAQRVRTGWRILALREVDGRPHITIDAVEAV